MSVKQKYFEEAIVLLYSLIEVPSFSKQEDQTAGLLKDYFQQYSIPVEQKGNNIWVKSKKWDEQKETLLLNSHHDTVKPVDGWVRNPFSPDIESGKLYGLGSNDAGGSLVALMMTFLHFYEKELPFNLLFLASAEEEISGKNGIASLKPLLEKVKLGIIGEPTLMEMAVAEKGLMVIDAKASGIAGHAAREEGENAIYKALKDIEWIQSFSDAKTSNFLGPTKMTVTQITAGYQHNVVPDSCSYVIDIRTNEHYDNRSFFEYLQQNLCSELKARSFRLNASHIPINHNLVQAGLNLGMKYFGSPTLSDQALLPFPCLKIGCGDSTRSHTPDEFIYTSEIELGIKKYIGLIEQYASIEA